jgi:hypothetical protein
MLEGAEPERLDQYAGFIRELHEKHTSKCWWLIYQADTRLRSERLGRLVRKAAADGSAPNYAKSRWSIAFTKAIDMEVAGMAEFWRNEVHRPASEFKAGLSSHQDLVRDGTQQWLQPQGSPGKRRRVSFNGNGNGNGYGTGTGNWQAPGNWNAQPWVQAQPWWEQAQPAWNDPWNVLRTQSKDDGKKGGKGKDKGKPKGKGKGGRGKGINGKGGNAKSGNGAPPPPPPAAPAAAGSTSG